MRQKRFHNTLKLNLPSRFRVLTRIPRQVTYKRVGLQRTKLSLLLADHHRLDIIFDEGLQDFISRLGLEDSGSRVRVGPVPQDRWVTTRLRRSGGLGRRWGKLQAMKDNDLCYPLVGGAR